MKKGQITPFIIIGILLLFSVGLLIYVSQLRGGITIFAQQESPLQQYVGACLESTSKDVITRIGITGGYVDIPENIAINERSYFSFAPKTQPQIPLWYYRGEPKVPTKSSMEGNISKYIVENINSCLGDFEAFKGQYELKSGGNISAETIISDTGVTIELNYPLEVTELQSGVITRVDSVTRVVEVKLGKMYNMAIDILRSENQQLYFENLTIELLSATSNFPISGLEFSCTPKTWKKSELVTLAKNIISANTQRVTVEGNPSTLFDKNDLYAKNHFMFQLSERYSDIGATFFYPTSARFELHVQPNDRELLRSNMGRSNDDFTNFLCINTWHFTHDIEYPLLTTLRDSQAFNGEGFIFNFAFPVSIKSNKGDKKDISATTFETPALSYDFCQNVNEQNVDVRVKNAYTNEEVYNAIVDYTCIKYRCDLGETKADGGSYRLVTKLPSACAGGQFRATAQNFLEGRTTYDDSGRADIFVKPLRTFKVAIVKHDADNFDRTEPLALGEQLAVVIQSFDDPNYEQFYISDQDVKEIQLVDGPAKYRLEAFLYRQGATGDILSGGYLGDWVVSYSELIGKSTITFHVIKSVPIPVTEDEQTQAAAYLFSDDNYQTPLKPTFS